MDATLKMAQLAFAAVDDDAAAAMLAQSVAALCASPSFHLQRHAPEGAVFVATYNLNPDTHRDYVDHYWRHDVWAQRFPIELGPRVANSESFVPKDEWESSEIYNELLRPNGDIYRCAGFVHALGDGTSMVVGAHRTRRQPAFTQEDLDRLQTAMPLLGRLMTARSRREAGHSELAARLLDAGPDPALAVDVTGAVRHQNRAAERAFAQGGPLVRSAEGPAAPREAKAAQDFARALRWACEGRGGSAVSLRDASGAAHAVQVDPLPGPAGLAALRWRDEHEQLRATLEAAVAALSLTSAEAAVADGLLRGLSPTELADRRGVSVTTVRSQLRGLFAKAGVTRQVELVARLRAGDGRAPS